MHKRKILSSFTFVLSLLILGALVHKTVIAINTSSPIATTYVDPKTDTIPVGQNFTINLNISNVIDLYGWEFKVKWNATLLDAVDVKEGSFLKLGGNTFFTFKINNTAGCIVADCTLLTDIPGVNDNGTLATIKFHCKNSGECPLDLYDVILVNHNEQIIPSQAVGGYIIGILHDIAVASVDVSPITVLPGAIIYVNVTLQNQGDFKEVFNVTVSANSYTVGVELVSLEKKSSITIPFAWNTTDFTKGDYTISASASAVQGEVDVANNSKVANSIVTILYPGHDIAVINVKPLKTVVGQGYCVNINVTVKNYGIFKENFRITTYVNTMSIQTKNVTLTSGNFIIITFVWNTTDSTKGNYTVKAYAWPILGEDNTADNTFVDGWVIVTIPGDIDGNFSVDGGDLGLLGEAWFSTPKDVNWNPNADVNDSGQIEGGDLGTVGFYWFQKDP